MLLLIFFDGFGIAEIEDELFFVGGGELFRRFFKFVAEIGSRTIVAMPPFYSNLLGRRIETFGREQNHLVIASDSENRRRIGEFRGNSQKRKKVFGILAFSYRSKAIFNGFQQHP